MKKVKKLWAVLLALVLMLTTLTSAAEVQPNLSDSIKKEGLAKAQLSDKGEGKDKGKDDDKDKGEDKGKNDDKDKSEGQDKDIGGDKSEGKVKGEDQASGIKDSTNEGKGAKTGEDANKGKEDKTDKSWKEVKDSLEAEKDAIEALKDEQEQKKDDLEKQYEAAKESGNTQLAEQLLSEITKIKSDIDSLKQQMKQKKAEMKEVIKKQYTEEELKELEEVAQELKTSNPDLTVLPIDSIVTENTTMKLDIPPVVKAGRTLVPVRALSEAFGATVNWNNQEQQITVVKDNVEITLTLGSNEAFVNNTKVQIDVPAQGINNRTLVPLRFIVENLGLKVELDEETQTINIEEAAAAAQETPAATIQ